MRVKKYLALTFAAILATTMLTGCPWDIEDDTASDSSSAPSSSSRPSHDSGSSDDDSGSAPSSPSTPDDEESENPDPIETLKQYGDIKDNTLTITKVENLSDESFLNALNNAHTITKIEFGENIISIPDDAFYKCTNLTSVELGNVTSIGGGAFFGCTSLTHIRLGENMEAFNETNLTGVHPDAFYGIAKTVHVYYGDNEGDAETKWTSLNVTPSGTTVEYHSGDDDNWDKRENNDNATEALPDAMKGLLALAERLG